MRRPAFAISSYRKNDKQNDTLSRMLISTDQPVHSRYLISAFIVRLHIQQHPSFGFANSEGPDQTARIFVHICEKVQLCPFRWSDNWTSYGENVEKTRSSQDLAEKEKKKKKKKKTAKIISNGFASQMNAIII